MSFINEQGAYTSGLNAQLGFVVIEDRPAVVRIDMPVGPDCLQPFGFVHGGATLALLEAAASRGAELHCDLETSRPFGTHMDVRHIRSCSAGTVHGVAELDHEEDLGSRGTKQVWNVVATDDEGATMSVGTFATRIVPLTYLEEKGVDVPAMAR